ncbi:MAG: MBL fold metallo-hydrolase [Bacteroidetes bacterium SW_9_63_38]|nr:MAG: MBL fold metallo-hydrolase [Bacteroidetes bacterium SW_9_63_38]
MPDRVHTLDLHFQNRPHTIASYLLPHANGAALIETGPGSTTDALHAQLAEHDLTPGDITEVFVTHIHLDHAGAAGWLATEHGATVYVHHVGASHLADPARLLNSAERIYGDDMDRLWGETLPVPEDQIISLHDGARVNVGDRTVVALDTPGHASHHLAYIVDDICFTGDVAGVRLPGETYVEVPLVPPELRLDHWRDSLATLRTALPERDVTHLAPTHFGLFDDVTAHLDRLEAGLDAADQWVHHTLPTLVDDEDQLRDAAVEWMHEHAHSQGVDEDTWALYELADPSWMAALGLRRYWKEHVQSQ